MIRAIPGIAWVPFAIVVERLREACETIGFLVITYRGIARPLIDDLVRAASGFFTLPLDQKMASVEPPGSWRGYTHAPSRDDIRPTTCPVDLVGGWPT